MTPKAQAELDRRTRIAHARYAKVLTLRNEGWRLKDIAREMGVSVERVRQMETKGWLIDTFYRPERIAAREQQAKEKAEEQAQQAARDAYWARLEREPKERGVVQGHAEQALWRMFTESRTPPVAHPPPWLQWKDTAGITYIVPGRLEPEWRVTLVPHLVPGLLARAYST